MCWLALFFFGICYRAIGRERRRTGGDHGLDVHWRTDFQHAGSRRHGENGGSDRAGDDGAVIEGMLPGGKAVRED